MSQLLTEEDTACLNQVLTVVALVPYHGVETPMATVSQTMHKLF
jgi:hypothetical protein